MISVGEGYHALVTSSRKGLCPLPLGIQITKKNTVQSSTEWNNALFTDSRAISASAVGISHSLWPTQGNLCHHRKTPVPSWWGQIWQLTRGWPGVDQVPYEAQTSRKDKRAFFEPETEKIFLHKVKSLTQDMWTIYILVGKYSKLRAHFWMSCGGIEGLGVWDRLLQQSASQ